MAGELAGRHVSGWTVRELLGSGKSALVFRAEKGGQDAALKVFDPELIERFGKRKQLDRIDRERALIGKKHKHLVEIFDGGECPETSHLFVAMDLIDASSLQSAIGDIPRDAIAGIIEQIASAARFLESNGLAHRDIKPENIAITTNYRWATLLDLGVLRPLGDSDLTDENGPVFVGTLRYSSPEFLLREEEQSTEGYRAITFYQLGAVLHDMIMQKPLFEEFSQPYMALGEAVKSQTPRVHANDISPELIDLARNCLVKEPDVRLKLVKWTDFQIAPSNTAFESARDRVKRRSLVVRSARSADAAEPSSEALSQIRQEIIDRFEGIVRQECSGNESFPRMQIVRDELEHQRLTVTFDASPEHSLPLAVCVTFRVELIDANTRSVRVHTRGSLVEGVDCEAMPNGETTLFLGPFDSEALNERLENALYVAIDQAQQAEMTTPRELDLSVLAVGEDN